MTIGFTGTQLGMTGRQHQAVEDLIANMVRARPLALREAHHGDCIGADAQFHLIARSYGFGVVLHPCDIEKKRAYCQPYVAECKVKMPLDRNMDIVLETEVLIATPKEVFERQRSGTWFTVRCARAFGRPIALVLPDGVVVSEGAPWPRTWS
jgi:hypothetical protein